MTIDQPPELLSTEIAIGGETHRLSLRMPLWSETLTAILRPDLRVPARLAGQLEVRIYDFVADDGGTGRPRFATITRWLTDPGVASALVDRHREVIEVASEAGAVYLGCPGCDGEVELTLTALAVAVGREVPPIFEGPFFALPPLASPTPRPPRDGLRTSRHVRFDLPGRALGLDAPLHAGFLGGLDDAPESPREDAIWRAWSAPEDAAPTSPRASWTRDSPGFRVSVRLAVALDDPRNGAVTPETVGALPVCDVFFLNTLYWLVYATTPLDPHLVACPRCGTEFSPVR